MDYDTKLALRALVSGLRYSNRIDDKDVLAIVGALEEAADTAMGNERQSERSNLRSLASDLGRDNGVGE